jgi:hypothetical protein
MDSAHELRRRGRAVSRDRSRARTPAQEIGRLRSQPCSAGCSLGLIGSGAVPDAGDRFPEAATTGAGPPSREEVLHDLCAIPIFVGIPAGAILSARGFATQGYGGWATYSRASAVVMTTTFVHSSAAFGEAPGLAVWGGAFQRLSSPPASDG